MEPIDSPMNTQRTPTKPIQELVDQKPSCIILGRTGAFVHKSSQSPSVPLIPLQSPLDSLSPLSPPQSPSVPLRFPQSPSVPLSPPQSSSVAHSLLALPPPSLPLPPSPHLSEGVFQPLLIACGLQTDKQTDRQTVTLAFVKPFSIPCVPYTFHTRFIP